ncbi:MAG TPA: aminotransferase class V-fold PLP-dependent enzyme [Acetobacteraceae bacterium]|nr:aminotransferase class V-fold PLP-dependent enzyme [Acetobacteraceae bacterium]
MIYLDANASEALRPEARTAMLDALDRVGNPASVHGAGRATRKMLEDAREAIASRFGGRAADLVFTSGGTEADALAIHGLGAGRRVIAGATEHDAIRASAPGAAILPVDRAGVADLAALDRLLADGLPALVCLMFANNETGTLQPVIEAATLCRRHGALLHVDAVQAAGRVPVSLAATGSHAMALSSHKLGGPAGAGALLLAPDLASIAPLMPGGGQERGRRGGTPPIAAIAGFAAAAGCAVESDADRLGPLRDAIERAALAEGAVVCGAGPARLANTSCLALPGVRADAQVIALDLAGFAVSAGAACSSGKIGASHVLTAMGLGTLAAQAIRVSLPWNVAEGDVRAFIAAYRDMAARLRPTLASNAA